MSLISHLTELRTRIVKVFVVVVLCAIVGFALWDWILRIATGPYCDAQRARGVEGVGGASACQLFITNPVELFTTRLAISGYLGLIFASPFILWHLWRFITPGLEKNEKRYAVPFVSASVVLFILGAAVAWLIFPRAISFFLSVGGSQIQTLFNPGPYLKLIFLMMLIFGVVFEFPLILIFLQLAGVLTSKKLRSWRRQAIVGNFLVAAIATPSQDPYSLLAMAGPLCVFYEIAILIGRLLKK